MTEYTTLLDAINGLKAEGYVEDFNLQGNCLGCSSYIKLHPNDFVIDKYFRFDNDSDPSDQSIVYAISSEKYNVKGVLVNSYGIYTEDVTDEMLEKLNVR